MIEYIYVYFFVWSFALFSLVTNGKIKNLFFVIQTLILAIFLAARFETGYDWPVYESHFLTVASGERFHLRFEIGYELIVYFFAKLNFEFHHFLAIISFFEIFIIASSIRFFFPKYYVLVVAVLYSFPDFFLIPFFSLIRQGLTVSLFFYGVKFLMKKRSFLAGFLFLLAFSIHYSLFGALLFLVLVFRFSVGKKSLIVFFLISGCAYLFSIDVARSLISFFVEYFDPKYLLYMDRDTYNASFAYRLVYITVSFIVFLCIYFSWRKRHSVINIFEDCFNIKIYGLAFLGLFIPLILYSFPTISTRYQLFFSIFTVGVCLSVLDFLKPRDRLLLAALVCILMYLPFYRFLKNPLSITYIPYQSQFEYDKKNSTGQQRTNDLLDQLNELWSE